MDVRLSLDPEADGFGLGACLICGASPSAAACAAGVTVYSCAAHITEADRALLAMVARPGSVQGKAAGPRVSAMMIGPAVPI
jgi:hypothetical protein